MKKPTKRPKTEAEMCAYRVELNCKIARDSLDGGRSPIGVSATEYALFCLADAICNLSRQITETAKSK